MTDQVSTYAATAVITGASSGIGQALARKLAQRGYDLVLIARRTDRLEQLRQELAGHRQVRVLTADLSAADVPPALPAALASLPPVEVLINNAGSGCYAPFLEIPPQEAQRLLRLNFESPVAITRLVLPSMIQRRRGHVINVCSMSTKMGPWGHSLYSASKSALVSFTQCLACEYERSGLHFSYVNPGIVDTEFFHRPNMAALWRSVQHYAISPQYVAERIVRLLDHPRLELCIPRHYRIVDWIQAISPRLLQRIVCRSSTPAAPADGQGASTAGADAESQQLAGKPSA